MKRIFGLTLMATACGAAFAQTPGSSSVTVYGIVDAGVVHTTGLSNNPNIVASGIMEGSRLGFRGNEDLGGGYRALFTLEHRLELDTGSGSNRPPPGTQTPDRLNKAALLGLPAQLQPAVTAVAGQIGSGIGVNLANNFWDRQAYIGLVTPFGGFLAGRQYTPTYEISATFDTLQTQSSLAAGQVASLPAGFDIRLSNTLQYRIVTGGLTASVMYGLGEVAGNSKANRFTGVMGMYKSGDFSVGLGYNKRNNDIGLKSLEGLLLGASMKVGPGTVSAMVGTIKDENPSGVSGISAAVTPLAGAAAGALVQSAFTTALKQDARFMHLGYRLTTGPNTFYVAYSGYNDRKAANADVASYGVAYTYSLSKRTDLNAVLTQFNNKGTGQAAPGQAGFLGGVTKSAGTDSTSVALGVRHRF
jgi:predicted porin